MKTNRSKTEIQMSLKLSKFWVGETVFLNETKGRQSNVISCPIAFFDAKITRSNLQNHLYEIQHGLAEQRIAKSPELLIS